MSVRIGINPLTWTNDDLPQLGGDTPVEVCLSEARAAGYSGIEMGHKFPRNAVRLRPLLERHGLDLISGWYSAALLERSVEAEIEAVRGHLDLLAAMGCEVMVFAEVTACVHGDRRAPLSKRPRLSDQQWSAFGTNLTRLAEHLQSRGLRLAYHHHMGTVIETEAEIDQLMLHTGEAVGLLLDTGHLAFADGDPVSVIARHGPRIVHVHCKDVRAEVLADARQRDRSFLDAVLDGVFTVPGDGSIDFTAVAAALEQACYHGWLVVEAEQDPEVAHPLTYARMGFEHLSRVADQAGLIRKR